MHWRNTASAATIAALFTFLPVVAQAQQATPSDGLALPDSSFAGTQDATAVEINPAGLAFMRTAELGYGYQLAPETVRGVVPEAHAVMLGIGNGAVGAGLAAQWVQRPALGGDLQRYRKYSLGLGAALGRTSVGLSWNLFGSSSDERLNELMSVDVGLQSRLASWLGLGVRFRDSNTPFLRTAADSLPVRVDATALFRFWDGRIQVEPAAVETTFRDSYFRLTPRLSVEPIDGLRAYGHSSVLLARVGDVVDTTWDGLVVGLEASLGSFGVSYAPAYEPVAPGEDLQFTGLRAYHWLSPNKSRPLFERSSKWIVVDLNKEIPEAPSTDILGRRRGAAFLNTLRELQRIEQSDDVAGVVFGLGGSAIGWGQAWEVRRQITAIRDSGKKTIAVLGASPLKQYYVASAAEEVWLLPSDVFEPGGLRSRTLHIASMLHTLGVEAQFVRIADHKSAPEMFVFDEPSEPALEQREAFVDQYWRTAVSAIAEARGKDAAYVEKSFERPLYPADAKAAGFVDRLVYPDEIESVLKEQYGASNLEPGLPEDIRDDGWKRSAEVAVIVIDGNIVKGQSGSTPLSSGSYSGSDTLALLLEGARKSPAVRAVVIRIDSPGGSAVGSDLIYRQIRKLADEKPVVVSMGNVAASGGYYVAAGADEIIATPLTLTGSIGIFTGKFNAERLAQRIGVSSTKIDRGVPAGHTDFWQPWSQAELSAIAQSMNYMYRLFLDQAAQSRPLTAEEIDAVARGRVWTGVDAKEHKLVDSVGGLLDAVRIAEEHAGLDPGEARVTLRLPSSGGLLSGDSVLASLVPAPEPVGLPVASALLTTLQDMEAALIAPLLYANGEALMLPEQFPVLD